MAVTPVEFREGLSRFASGVTVVTTLDADGLPHGLTVSAFCSLSLEPPLVLICIEKGIRSHQALSRASRFVVNILSSEQLDVSSRFASPLEDRFEGVEWRAGTGGVPVIEGTLANLECTIHSNFEGGDHTIFVGRVESLSVSDGAPLLYFKSTYRELDD
ncbi:MAG: flavin reductase family protein [Acidobacteria bacterium]|nr:flavin reductase family protein [Acidobacteriota bacterium]